MKLAENATIHYLPTHFVTHHCGRTRVEGANQNARMVVGDPELESRESDELGKQVCQRRMDERRGPDAKTHVSLHQLPL